jgi:hypothetical protein
LKLSIFHSPQTGFWTESVTFDAAGGVAPKIEKSFPKDAGDPVLIQPSRISINGAASGTAANRIKSIAAFGTKSVEGFFRERG